MDSKATTTVEHTVPGLEAPAEIVVDTWGIPHIRAATRRDIFFVQGFNAARDRLWQLDIWRKRGLGRLAADFGPGFLAQDRAARLFLYRGDMDAEWASYGTPEAKSITEAFAAGINAFIDLSDADHALRPPEFAAMGTRPEKWAAEDVVRIRSHALVRNVLSEVARAQVAARAGIDADLARMSLEPAWKPVIPEGLDLATIPPDVLDDFRLATAALDMPPARLTATLIDAWKWTKVNDLGNVYFDGSNNWVVAPARTATGRPILGSDPHRAHQLPSLRYIVHLTGPGLDVIGSGEPAIPGVSFGHNEVAGFALTIFPMDQADLYVYETNPDDPDQYRFQGGWERMTTLRETVRVRSATDQQVALKFTRHGPVVKQDRRNNRAYAIRSVWSEPGTAAYYTSLACMQAKTPAQYADAVAHWKAPTINHVYADTGGNIAWLASGLVPYRRNFDGLLPVPGDGRYEWDGFVAATDLPRDINPEKGFFATANEMNLPPDYPIDERRLGFEWAEHSRTDRIHQVLGEQEAHTLEQSMQLQTDSISLPGLRVQQVIAHLAGANSSSGGDLAGALELLRGWDGSLARDSGPGALFELWWTKHLKPAMLDLLVPDPAIRPLMAPGDHETLLGMLEGMDPRIGDRDALLRRTLAAAFADARARMGDNLANWAWGRLHHGKFVHPLAAVRPGFPEVGPLPKAGSGSVVMNAGYRPSDFRVTSGASFRMVLDVGNWDASVTVNAPGQSGDPRSPHYAALAPKWAAEEYVPMLYSREAVDAAASVVIKLTPR
ncbi:MAG: penicillin acylase family protein [Acetobacteraceae bacterium]|nr:penicillin acylase family protein [Acetobacteraceae bacterium]